MRLLKRIAFLLALTAFLPLGAIECEALATLVPRLADRCGGVPAGFAAPLPTVSHVSRHQPFSIQFFFRDPVLKDGKMRVSARVILRGPSGQIRFDSRDSIKVLDAPGPRPGREILHPAGCRIVFGRDDAEGEYTVDVAVTDLLAKRTAHGTAAITLADRLPEGAAFTSMREFDEFIMGYYRAPDPERIMPAFRFLAGQLPELRKRRHFTPVPLMAWFYYALKVNPQLWKDFAKQAAALDPADRPHAVAVLAALTGKGTREPAKLKSVYEPPEKLTAPWQLDVLWSRFFAAGDLQPVERLCGEVARVPRGITPEAYKKLAAPTAEDKAKLLDHVMGRGALWSLGANARKHPLAAAYIQSLLGRKRITDMFAAQSLLRVLQTRAAQPVKP